MSRRIKRVTGVLSVIMLVALSAIGCNRHTVYSHYEHAPVQGWEKNDTLFFYVSPVSAEGTYYESVGLRTSGAYPFMSLSLIVEQTVLPQGATTRNVVNLQLTKENGISMGKGISHYQYQVPLTQLSLQQGDSLRIAIRHDMKREILPGIADVGVNLVRQ